MLFEYYFGVRSKNITKIDLFFDSELDQGEQSY